MALFSRLPSGSPTGIDSDKLSIVTNNTAPLTCEVVHRAVYGKSVFIGAITSSCDCTFNDVLISVIHNSDLKSHAGVWYEIRDNNGMLICMFSGNNGSTEYAGETVQYAPVMLKKGENKLYVCTSVNSSNYGGNTIKFNFQVRGASSVCLSSTTAAPTLTWVAA